MLNSVKEVLVKDIEVKDVKNVLMTEIEMSDVKGALLKEIDISKLKESLIKDLKETLLQEIDISGLKEALTKEIIVKDFFPGESNTKIDSSNKREEEKSEEKVEKKAVDLPAYKYGLTDSFKNNNQEILSISEIIMHLANEKEYATLPLMLSKFSKKCVEHFSEEEELYTYMKALAGNRSEIERKVAIEFSQEMKNLSISLFSILNQSNYIPVTDDTVDGFIEELGEIGKIVTERIRREEKILYPLYENSRKVVNIC